MFLLTVGARNERADMPNPVASMTGPLGPALYRIRRRKASPPSAPSACHPPGSSYHQIPPASRGSPPSARVFPPHPAGPPRLAHRGRRLPRLAREGAGLVERAAVHPHHLAGEER